jgi:hypothetical protein
MRFMKIIGFVVAFSAFGCGSDSATDLCNKAVAALNGLSTKAQPCNIPIPFTPPDCAVTGSQSFDNRCSSDADKQIINDVINCVNALPACTPTTIETWGGQANACLSKANQLSPSCQGT